MTARETSDKSALEEPAKQEDWGVEADVGTGKAEVMVSGSKGNTVSHLLKIKDHTVPHLPTNNKDYTESRSRGRNQGKNGSYDKVSDSV